MERKHKAAKNFGDALQVPIMDAKLGYTQSKIKLFTFIMNTIIKYMFLAMLLFAPMNP